MSTASVAFSQACGRTAQDEEERLLHPFQIHNAKHNVVIDLAKRIHDGKLVVDHSCGGLASVGCHTQPGAGSSGGE